MAHRVGVPPVGAAQGQGEPGHDDEPKRGQAGHAEDVDPRGHVGGLAVRQQLAGREHPQGLPAQPRGPHGRIDVVAEVGALERRGERGRLGRRRPVWRLRLFAGRRARRVARLMFGETQEQGGAEDHHHHRDEDQVGLRDREDRPVQVATGPVQVDRRSRAEHSGPVCTARAPLGIGFQKTLLARPAGRIGPLVTETEGSLNLRRAACRTTPRRARLLGRGPVWQPGRFTQSYSSVTLPSLVHSCGRSNALEHARRCHPALARAADQCVPRIPGGQAGYGSNEQPGSGRTERGGRGQGPPVRVDPLRPYARFGHPGQHGGSTALVHLETVHIARADPARRSASDVAATVATGQTSGRPPATANETRAALALRPRSWAR